jgi:hypothetical protein
MLHTGKQSDARLFVTHTPTGTAEGSDLSPDRILNTSECVSDEFAKFDLLLGKLKASRQHMSPFSPVSADPAPSEPEDKFAALCRAPLALPIDRPVLDCNPEKETTSEDEFAKLDGLLARLRETRASLASIHTFDSSVELLQ